jgi:hypothetical protein
LRELGDAVYRADQNPELVLWLELLTVAHITGRPAPAPDASWIASLHSRYDARTLDCAVAHRIQAAVDARYAGITEHNAAGEFVAHLASSARLTLAGSPSGCDGTEVRWQAGSYRWSDVMRALKRMSEPDGGPHPDTAKWAERGIVLRGATGRDQLAELVAMPAHWRQNRPAVLGTVVPSLVEGAVRLLDRHTDPAVRFREATAFLNLGNDWAINALRIGKD